MSSLLASLPEPPPEVRIQADRLEIRIVAFDRLTSDVQGRTFAVPVWPGVAAVAGFPTRQGRFALAERDELQDLADGDPDWLGALAHHTIRDVVLADLMRPVSIRLPIWTGATPHAATSLLVDRLWAKIRLAFRPSPPSLWAVAPSSSRVLVTHDPDSVPDLLRLGERLALEEARPLPTPLLQFTGGRWIA